MLDSWNTYNSTDWEPFVIHMTHWTAAGQMSRRSEVTRSGLSSGRCRCCWCCALPRTGPTPRRPGMRRSRRSACWSTSRGPALSGSGPRTRCWAGARLSPPARRSGTCTRRGFWARNWREIRKFVTHRKTAVISYIPYGFPSYPYMYDPAVKNCL